MKNRTLVLAYRKMKGEGGVCNKGTFRRVLCVEVQIREKVPQVECYRQHAGTSVPKIKYTTVLKRVRDSLPGVLRIVYVVYLPLIVFWGGGVLSI